MFWCAKHRSANVTTFLVLLVNLYLIIDIFSSVPSNPANSNFVRNELLFVDERDRKENNDYNALQQGHINVTLKINTPPPLHPERQLTCVYAMMQTYFTQLSSLRNKLLQQNIQKKSFHSSADSAFLEDPLYFNKLREHSAIETLFLNVSIADTQRCLNPSYSYKYSSTDCGAVLTKPKRHDLYGSSLYGLQCNESLHSSVVRDILHTEALQAGLPANFTHEQGKVTLTFIHVATNAILDGMYGDVFTEQMKIINNRCHPEYHKVLNIGSRGKIYHKEVFSIRTTFGEGMFHGNVEELSRLAAYIPFLEKNPEIKIHIGNYHVFMDMMNLPFPKSRYIHGPVRAGIVYMPAGAGCCRPSAFTTQVLSFSLRRSLSNHWPIRDTIILVHRSHARRSRYFAFHDSLAKTLQDIAEQYRLRLWVFNDDPVPPIQETAAMFNRAVVVVAPHGAGQSNMLFTQPNTALVEGLCVDREDGKVNLAFRNLAHNMGAYYYGVFRQKPWKCPYTQPRDIHIPVTFFIKHILKMQYQWLS